MMSNISEKIHFEKYSAQNSHLYKEPLFSMMKTFYASPAVLHNIPESHFERTLKALDQESPLLEATLFLVDSKVVGYALLAFMYSNEGGGLTAWIDELYIQEDYRNRGIGSQFLRDTLQTHKDVKRFRLESEPENEGAIKLYQRLGFEQLGYLQYFFDPKE